MNILLHFFSKNSILLAVLGWTLFFPAQALASETRQSRVEGGWIVLREQWVIDASIDTLAHFLKDVQKSVAIIPGLNKKTILKQISATERIDCDLFKLPRPFKDRYVIYHAKQEYDIGHETLFTVNSLEDYPFEDEGKVLGVVREGSLLLRSLENDETKTNLTVTMQVDPGGFIPVWLLSLKLKSLLKDLFKNFKKNIKKEISRQNTT
jgi:carbon monoxide dehydrogenase subunit G